MSETMLQLPQGPVRVREEGSGPPIVFIHGLLADGRLWDEVVAPLSTSARCIVPDLPLGAHRTAMRPDADLTPYGLAKLFADLLAAPALHARGRRPAPRLPQARADRLGRQGPLLPARARRAPRAAAARRAPGDRRGLADVRPARSARAARAARRRVRGQQHEPADPGQ